MHLLQSVVCKFKVIALSETWLITDKHRLSDFETDGYTLYTESRKEKSGGGVAIYISDEFEHKKLDDMSLVDEDCMESIFVESSSSGEDRVHIVQETLKCRLSTETKRTGNASDYGATSTWERSKH